MVIVQGQCVLLEIVAALHSSCRFTSGLNRWQNQSNENADNGDDDKKFYEGKNASPLELPKSTICFFIKMLLYKIRESKIGKSIYHIVYCTLSSDKFQLQFFYLDFSSPLYYRHVTLPVTG